MTRIDTISSATALSRRDFLNGSLALALGCAAQPLLTAGARAQTAEQKILCGSHWGAFYGRVEDGRAVEFIPWEGDPAPTPQLPGVLDSIYSPSRIRYPMVRRAWLEKGPGSDNHLRGNGDFVRVSWDQALDLVAKELVRVRDKYGYQSIFGGSYGWKSPGRLHNCQTLLQRMLNLTGTFSNRIGDYSTGAAQVILPYVSGSIEVYEQCTTYNNLAENSELIVYWGCNPLNCSQISWQVADHGAWPGIAKLKAAGIKVISIDPVLTETCKELNGEWLAPRPHTDVAMMLGIAHTLYEENLYDRDFIARYTTGFDRFVPYLTGQSDGTPKSADWASAICGLPAEKLRELARQFAGHRTMLKLGWSSQRQHHGEQTPWMLVTLACMLGQIGLPGGGYGMSYHYSSGGTPTRTTPILNAIDSLAGKVLTGADNAELPWLKQGGAVSIPVSRFVETLLNPGATMHFNGTEIKLPVIKAAYWAGGNPFAHHQDRNEMLKAWQVLDSFIVHDFQWTATARHADIILPATTSYERNDIEHIGDYSLSHIMPMKKIIEPVFEARNDFDIFADLAGRFGKKEDYTNGLSEMDWIRNFYEATKIEARAKGMEMPVFDVFWDSNKPLEFPSSKEQDNYVRHADFRADPLLNALGTASGKFEIFSTAIEKFNYDDCPPHPTWMEPIERLDGPTAKFPLHIASNHPQMRLHSQLGGTINRETFVVKEREPCWMNPADAAHRGLQDGDVVRVFNDRGQILAGLKLTDDIRPGVIRINEGGWFDPVTPGEIGGLCAYGDVNLLTTGIATSKLAQANCGQTGLAEVERFDGILPPVQVFNPVG